MQVSCATPSAGVFKPYGNTATADVTRLRMSVTISIATAQKLFGTKWELYRTSTGGTNLSLDAANAIVATGPWNDTAYPAPYTSAAGGGGGLSTIVSRPWWQPTQSYNTSKRTLATGLGSPVANLVAAALPGA